MTRFVWHNNEWVSAVRADRVSVFPSIISDGMGLILHPADGGYYDSKSAFRRVTRAHGFVEMGNDAPIARPAYTPQGVREDIEKSVKMLNEGYRPEPDERADTLEGIAVETRIMEDTE